MQRKLAAILSADAAGCSRLMADDELAYRLCLRMGFGVCSESVVRVISRR